MTTGPKAVRARYLVLAAGLLWTYACVTVAFATLPWWRLLRDRTGAIVVLAPGCGATNHYIQEYERREEVRARVLPLVLATGIHRGDETPASAWSCDLVAARMREDHPWLHAVPQRYLCQSVRRWARTTVEAGDADWGTSPWIVDGVGHSRLTEYDALTRKGIGFNKQGLTVEPVR